MSKQIVGLIGLGAMGEPMAANLLKAGLQVVSCANRNREPIERLKSQGLKEVSSPAQVGAEVDVLMSVVWDEAQNDLLLRGPGGALNTLKPGSFVLIMSTVSPVYCRELAEEAAQKDIHVMDCPIAGMPRGARDGTLSLMIGGAEEQVDACRPVLEPMGTVYPCGPIGAGQIVKLGNNALSISQYRALMEVRDMVRANGVDESRFLEILNVSTGRSWFSENVPLPPGRVAWTAMPIKDLSTALDAAKAAGVDMPLVQSALDVGRKEGK